jgi:hypothetical protein
MSFSNASLLDLWKAVVPRIAFDPENLALCRQWASDPYRYGSPLGPERDHPDGGTVQMFVLKALRWTGSEVVEE